VVAEEEQVERGEWYLAKQIAVGILIAAAVIFVGLHVYAYLVAKAAEQRAAEFMQQAQQELNAGVEQQSAAFRAQMVAQREAERAAADRRAAAELERRQALAGQTQAAADQAKLEQANAAARERAWQQFYKPPKKCENPPDWDTQVECGNAHIKARREFEARWERGAI